MSALTREAVLEQFDRLQREGELFYASTTPIKQFSGGLEVRIAFFFFQVLRNSKVRYFVESVHAETAKFAQLKKFVANNVSLQTMISLSYALNNINVSHIQCKTVN